MSTFFRLAVAERNPYSGQLSGVFVAAYRLRREGVDASDELDDVLDWFGRSLRAPRWMAGAAIFWFRGVANPCTQRIWQLA
jgi:hypothetical protein